ncbi:MAG TPA: phosphoribosylformylglycinamidine cyclo-ligase [Candidatus Dormibacteraeota bacterium]|nr:phosphoribosylformylglycinamidine cyclo-ligase [Candidatus Dormibacteraeota bacterium]
MTTYRDAGVDIDAGNRTVELIRPLAAATQGPEVLAGVGPFSGLFALDTGRYRQPVLIASTDGVGTKLLLASAAGRHAQVGADLVNHCVNDVLTAGAEPLFFLDYVATGVLEPRVVAEVVSGMAEACRTVGCALLGGETAEMPGLYQAGVYDVAGFMVGACERDAIIDGTSIGEGDALLALPSTGLHTNGYSLARHVIPRQALTQTMPQSDQTVLDALLAPHRAYLDPVRRLRERIRVKGLAHITGGGIVGNLPRILPLGLGARIQRGTWPEPPIFSYLAPFVSDEELWRTFNMGIGMIVVVDEPSASIALETLPGEIFLVGDVVSSEQRRVQIVE